MPIAPAIERGLSTHGRARAPETRATLVVVQHVDEIGHVDARPPRAFMRMASLSRK